MQKITLLALAAFLAMPSVEAQTTKKKAKFVGAAVTQTTQNDTKKTARRVPRLASQSATSIWKPRTEQVFECWDGEWMLSSTYTYTYNIKGLPVVTLEDMDGDLYRTTYTYNENGKKTVELVESAISEDGEVGEFTPSEKKVKEYDPIMKDLVVLNNEMVFDEVENDWVVQGNCFKRTITRDAANNVTGLTVATWLLQTAPNGELVGDYSDIEKFEVTYDADGKASTYSIYFLDYDYNTGTTFWGTPTEYKNIKWQNTNGQFRSTDFTEYLVGDNRVASADVYEDGEQTGTITVTYKEGTRDFTAVIEDAEGISKEVHMLETLDENGSYKESFVYYEDMDGNGKWENNPDEGIYEISSEEVIANYDAQGNLVKEEYFMEMEGERESMGATIYDLKYEGPHGELSETLISEDYGDGAEPMMKIVASDFFDVVSGINNATTLAGPTKVYNLQGVMVGTSTDNLPAGLYIIQKGSKSQKVLKK